MTIAQTLSQKLARAKALLRRDETRRGMEELLACLEEYQPHALSGMARFEIEVQFQECVGFLNRQPAVRSLVEGLVKSGKPGSIPYTPGHEQKLKGLLALLFKALMESEAAGKRNEERERAARKATLENKALEALKAGDSPRGKGTLRILAEEFGQEPNLLSWIGEVMLQHKLYFEAAEIL